MYRYRAYNQSSWGAGCGFGMFATVDYHDSRYFRCSVSFEDQTSPAILGPELDELSLQVRVVPSDFNLSLLANKLSAQQWHQVQILQASNSNQTDAPQVLETIVCADSQATHYIKDKYEGQNVQVRNIPIQIQSLDLQIFGVRMDLTEKKLSGRLLNKISLTRKTDERNHVAGWNEVF